MKHRVRSGDPAVDALLGTAHQIREQANATLATCGLSLWTFKSLRALCELGPSRSVDLGEHLGIAARTVTGAVDVLEAEGLVERQVHPTDRRAHLIVLTPKGDERLKDATLAHRRFIARVTRSLSEDDRDTLIRLLAVVSADVEPDGEPGALQM